MGNRARKKIEQEIYEPGSDDLSSGFDPNIESERLTSRSKVLSEVEGAIGQDPMDWNKMVSPLHKAQNEHETRYVNALLAPPAKDQRTPGKGDKFTKQ